MFLPQFYQRPSVPGKRNDWSVFPSGLRGGHSNAGVVVTPETAMAIGAVRACVTLLAESVAQLPCELYRRSKDGGRERAADHPLYASIAMPPSQSAGENRPIIAFTWH